MIFTLCLLLETQDDASHAIGSRYPLLREKNTPRRRVQCFGSLWGLQRHQAILKTLRFESLWSLVKKEREAFNDEYGCHREHWIRFLLARGHHVFFCGLLCAVHSTCFQFSTGKILGIQNPAGFDDKSTRSWSFSTGGVLKFSMGSGFLETQTTSLKWMYFW